MFAWTANAPSIYHFTTYMSSAYRVRTMLIVPIIYDSRQQIFLQSSSSGSFALVIKNAIVGWILGGQQLEMCMPHLVYMGTLLLILGCIPSSILSFYLVTRNPVSSQVVIPIDLKAMISGTVNTISSTRLPHNTMRAYFSMPVFRHAPGTS
eukprot:11953536-Ditylum_brightwellii.AAC.1